MRPHCVCVTCGQYKRHAGEGQCDACRTRTRGYIRPSRGGPGRPPGMHSRTAALLEEYEWLRADGHTLTAAALRLGVKRESLMRALERHGYRHTTNERWERAT